MCNFFLPSGGQINIFYDLFRGLLPEGILKKIQVLCRSPGVIKKYALFSGSK
jgi:hypothetical protein